MHQGPLPARVIKPFPAQRFHVGVVLKQGVDVGSAPYQKAGGEPRSMREPSPAAQT